MIQGQRSRVRGTGSPRSSTGRSRSQRSSAPRYVPGVEEPPEIRAGRAAAPRPRPGPHQSELQSGGTARGGHPAGHPAGHPPPGGRPGRRCRSRRVACGAGRGMLGGDRQGKLRRRRRPAGVFADRWGLRASRTGVGRHGAAWWPVRGPGPGRRVTWPGSKAEEGPASRSHACDPLSRSERSSCTRSRSQVSSADAGGRCGPSRGPGSGARGSLSARLSRRRGGSGRW